MNDKIYSFSPRIAGLVIGAVFLGTLTGCVAYVDRPPQGSVYEDNSATFLVQDDYVYYPQYECYYSVSRHQYAYREGNAWVARPAPRGVSVNVLVASPSVRMNFHDAPAQHHAAVVQQYPKNWKPDHAKPGQNRNEDKHEENNGR
jgi:hypothetical protein